MSHKVETMAYVGDLPWHGLGDRVDASIGVPDMLKAAKLDWTVSKRPIMVPQGPTTMLQSDDEDDSDRDEQDEPSDVDPKDFTLRVNDYYMLVRDKDNRVFGPCGKQYLPVQNEASIGFFEKFAKAGDMTLETAGALDKGKIIWGLAKVNAGFTLPGGDQVNPYLLLTNPHVWGKSLTIMFTPIRVVCMNTLTMALATKGERFRHPHIREFNDDVQNIACEAVGLAHARAAEFKLGAELMASTGVTDAQAQAFIAQIFSPKAVNAFDIEANEFSVDAGSMSRTASRVEQLIRQQPGAKLASSQGTVWGMFNAVTYYFDHEAGRAADNRLTNAWIGANSATKRKAFELAMEMAEAFA